MTDPTLPPDDELISAYLDGALAPGDAVRLEGDPHVEARLAELTAIRNEIAAAVPRSLPARREAAIAAALGVFDDEVPVLVSEPGPARRDEEPSAPDAPRAAVDLTSRRAQRHKRLMSVAAAAAVIALVLGGAGLLRTVNWRPSTTSTAASSGGRPPSSTVNQAMEGSNRVTGASPGGATDSAAESITRGDTAPRATSAPTTTPNPGTPNPAPVELGRVETPTQLQSAVIRGMVSLLTPPAAVAPPASEPDRLAGMIAVCETSVRGADPQVRSVLLTGTATYAGSPVLVLVFRTDPVAPSSSGALRIYAVDPPTCRVRAVESL